MSSFEFSDVHPAAAARARPFFERLVAEAPGDIRSIYVTGSSVTPDFNERTSDVNSLLVLPEIRLELLDFLSKLGRQQGKRGVRAPLLMTPDYIQQSLDVFPVEFLDLQLVSQLVMGEELLENFQIDRACMRLQCERELKGRLITLRQGYIRALGDRRLLRELLVGSLVGLIPLLRGLLFALGRDTPRDRAGIFGGITDATGVGTSPVDELIQVKGRQLRLSVAELSNLFGRYYETIQKLSDAVDAAS